MAECTATKSSAVRLVAYKNNALLLGLPVEILLTIFDEVCHIEDAICLCLAHSYLGSIGESHVNHLISRALAPFSAVPIACIGQFAKDDDYPPQIQPFVAAWEAASPARYQRRPGDSFYDFMWANYPDRDRPLDDLVKLIRERKCLFTPREHRKFMKLVDGVNALRRLGSSTILLNLTKMEYVRNDAVEALQNRLCPQATLDYRGRNITLGQALLSKVCWTSSGFCGAEDCKSKKLFRGQWAGDRFTVTDPSGFVSLNWKDDWKDVTVEVVAWLEELYHEMVPEHVLFSRQLHSDHGCIMATCRW